MNIHVNATFWNRAKIYLTCIKHLFWLITIPNVNKINPLFSTILQQTHTILENIAVITQIMHRAKWYFTSTSKTCHMITVPHMYKIDPFFSEISQQILVVIFTQIWHRDKCYFTRMSNAWYLITIPNTVLYLFSTSALTSAPSSRWIYLSQHITRNLFCIIKCHNFL